MKKIKKILISVYNKSTISALTNLLDLYNIEIISTGGTKKELEKNGIKVTSVESLTEYPSILGGRVKTLHPKIFGGILKRADNTQDDDDLKKLKIEQIDMVIVDLYPFQETVEAGKNHKEIIEKIDIGGVSLIRAAAKNYNNVLIIPSLIDLHSAIDLIISKNGCTEINDRLIFAKKAFNRTLSYESEIARYFNSDSNDNIPRKFNQNIQISKQLRYGENPHQEGIYYGELDKLFDQLNGKELSYNNLLDIDAAVNLMNEFDKPSFAILKHNNACGFASNNNLNTAWKQALAGDPISAFGGVIITNQHITIDVAKNINELFFEVLIAPSFDIEAIELLKIKKNRIILKKKNANLGRMSFRTVLNGVLCQEKDLITDQNNITVVSNLNVSDAQMDDLIFASKICKHTKSNAIVLAKDNQLLASGCGQTSRVDALKQAILKAKHFGFSLNNAVMASDAFFPFPDCVEIAGKEGINAVIQPGGSKNDQLSIDYCNENSIAMTFTGNRHFKH
tara:strand:- start:17 stop:1540 length:1524 start_codon:yes stop_codon:yes gene_type:complete